MITVADYNSGKPEPVASSLSFLQRAVNPQGVKFPAGASDLGQFDAGRIISSNSANQSVLGQVTGNVEVQDWGEKFISGIETVQTMAEWLMAGGTVSGSEPKDTTDPTKKSSGVLVTYSESRPQTNQSAGARPFGNVTSAQWNQVAGLGVLAFLLWVVFQ